MTAGHWLALLAGVAIGALAALLVRARQEQARRVELEVLRVRLGTEETRAAARAEELDALRDQMQAAFGGLARDSLASNSEMFLKLARERLGAVQADAVGALQQRESAIEGLVRPIREALGRTEAQIQSLERERIDAFATLKTQIEQLALGQTSLSRETRNLVTALRRPDVRGQWGEITLRRVVELAGMTANVDFTEQSHIAAEGGNLRPDMIVHMPEQRQLVVDVKTPLDAYLSAVEARTDEERAAHLKRHASLVGARVRELASKRYWAQLENSPSFVILFLPGDQFLAAALEESPALIDEALRQSIMLATPTTLMALLKSVAHGWKQALLAENAQEIRRLGEDLHRRLGVFTEHLARLGKALGTGVESYNKAVGSLESQVLSAARRFPELGTRESKVIEPLEPVSQLVREPRAATGAEPRARAALTEREPAVAPPGEADGAAGPAAYDSTTHDLFDADSGLAPEADAEPDPERAGAAGAGPA